MTEYRVRQIRHNRAWRDNGRWAVEQRWGGKGRWIRVGPVWDTKEIAEEQLENYKRKSR